MLEFGDSIYYLDLKAFDKAITVITGKGEQTTETEQKVTTDATGTITLTENYTKVVPKSKEIDGAKYDLLKTFIEYIIDNEDISDDTLGADRALSAAPFAYKIVFNTLISEGIIKEKNQ